ncbi:G surface protein, allelic form 156 [Anastrepha ludens]|uniref:G surface protein, allelic form 156 n=1 Tax=Anastrepha ludens TaxID=28586 RepID=UPI0023AFEBA6|nr:G surface protein, allelic form 156 [Anastrepha ludens]
MFKRNIKIGYLLIGLVLYCANREFVAASDFQCYHCAGDDCDDPSVKECTDESESAQCYIRLDGNYDFIGMGCASDLGNETEIADLIRNKTLYVCSTSNCNGYENLSQPNECTDCNSSEDVRCATQPQSAGRTVRCSTVPYTKCYERVSLANGTTERGCLFELEGDEFYNCLNSLDANCNVCSDSRCNVGTIPANRLQCQRCDSSTDSNCSSSPSALSICPTYLANDACVSVYESGVTRRGCYSELSCNSTSRSCEICTTSGCNKANVEKRSTELYGIFQDLPLNCYNCTGEECLEGRKLRKCEGDIYQDCVTVFSTDGIVVARGCDSNLDSEYQTHCTANPELCFNCKSNGCNNITEVKSTQQCVYCDASINAECVTNVSAITTTRKCIEGCVTALYESKSNSKVSELARTCFEDLEFDDRSTCTEGNNCVKCTDGDKCNTAVVPTEGRLTCLHCDGDDCDEPVSRSCVAYSISDQCYMYFDLETHSAIRMGCKSSVSDSVIYNDILHYFLCDGDNCNTYSTLPEAHMCYVCNSATNVDCAINPTALTAQTRCQINPHTDCFTRINEDGHTIRGCISTLNNTEFLSCHEGTYGELCRICTESDCNKNVYPSRRQLCHRCNSTVDSTCETEPQAESVCPIYDENDYCVSKLSDGVVYRGCGSEIQCDANSTSKTCRTCEDNNCNSAIFKDEAIGKPGYFQDLPLNCYHCDSSEECSVSLGKVKKCENNNLQTCTTVFDSSNGSVVLRSCSDTADEACDDDSNNCYGCKSNGCNVATSESAYIDCIFCDAQENENCLTNVNAITQTRKCLTSCVTALYNRTSDTNPVHELIRTCLDDMDLDDREICAAGNDANCKACSSEKCNVDTVGTRISCYQCVGDECQDAQPKTCRASSEGDRCFVQYDEQGSIVELGCQSKYDPAEVKVLVVAKMLWLCEGENCNTIDSVPSSQVCAICSSATDAACATAPSSVQSVTTCAKTPYTQCYSRVLDGGHTERGCLSSIEGEDFYDCLSGTNSTKCLACVGANCNTEVYPANRLSCHQCNSISSATCESVPANSEICLKYSASEQCVSILDNSGVTIRGCSSEVACNSGNCQTCVTNDCNSVNLKRKSDGNPGVWQELPLTCKACDSQSDCAGTPSDATCPQNDDYCMTVFGEDDSVVKRGCSSAVEATFGEYCDANSTKCHNCNSNGCNTASALSDYVDCIYCDSETNSNCVSNLESVTTRRQCNKYCMTALRPQSNGSDVFELTRTCLDDKDAADQVACQAGSEQCVACQGSACNTAKLPEARLSCYICEDDECVTPETAECSAYKADDQCFILFDGVGDIKRMGCVSELESSFVEKSILLLLLCDEGDNCNSFDNLPTANTCVQCDSEDDQECASVPSNVATVTKCATLPRVECYTQVLTNGTTRRGCATSLSDTVLTTCLNSNSTSCETCTSDLCNGEVYPADRRRCHRCNSAEDATCESSPAASSACPFYDTDEFCTVKLVQGITYRGCSSEFQCDVTNRQYCRHCTGEDNCNTVDLTKLEDTSIGDPGKWQDLPLSCYTCDSGECNSSLGSLNKCENNNLQNCETVFATNGSVVARGCSDDVLTAYEDYCDNNSCIGCKSNSCNNATSLDQYVECYSCDSIDNSTCAVNFVGEGTKTRKCQNYCAIALYPRSSADNSSYELTRTCLDDMELADREKCLAGENELCTACTGPLCNSATFPANRQKCYKCVDSDCTDYAVSECTAYHPNDQCYISFDDENSVVSMGCRSEFEPDIVPLLVKGKKFLLCDGEACNGPETIPTAKTCSTCDSATDTRCATNPNLVNSTERCTALPYTNCYTRVNENGYTTRGCLSSLTSDIFYACLTGNDTLCDTCSGDNCNAIDVFPSDRLNCQQCSSDTDTTCTSNPNSNQVCPIYSATDSCVTNWNNGTTTRGCSSNMTCDDESNKSTCSVCSTSGCNTINLENIQAQGQPGRWQDVPITCRTCEGEDECSTMSIYRVCTGYAYQSCMTVFNTAGKVIQRGCSDTVEEANRAHCRANPENCLLCNSNGCNNATQLENYIDCYYCDSDSNSDCVQNVAGLTKQRKCNTHCMTALYPKYDEVNPAYALSRSCLDDMDLDEREACLAGSNALCQACDEADCNTQLVPSTRLSCNVCSGDDCQDPQSSNCTNYREGDRCYIQFDEQRSLIAMGCRSEFTNAEADYLLQQKRLYFCEGNNCNTFDAIPTSQVCTICSSRTDTACATNPTQVTAATTCALTPYTQCYSRVLSSGATERGCLSSLYDDEFASCLNGTATNCEACVGNYCNQKVYPESRLSCHICDSTTNSSCTSNPDSVSVCPLYVNGDQCVTAYTNGVTYRGCNSSLQCSSTDSKSCVQCEGNGCNTINLERQNDDNYGKWQDLPLTCLSCTSDTCNSSSTVQSLVCEYNNEQDCVTVFENDIVVRRGCSDVVWEEYSNYCNTNSNDCLNCKSNDCNNATAKSQYTECIYCDTNKNFSCLLNAESSAHKTRLCQGSCMTALYPSDGSTDPAYELIRTCLDDKEAADQATCAAGRDTNCKSCTGSKCNNEILPASRLSCYQCDGSNCDEPELKICPLYKSEEKCYTWYDETNSINQMGCLSSFGVQDLETIIGTKRIHVCEGEGCNSLDDLPTTQKCAVCDSNTDSTCATNALEVSTFSTCNQYPYTSCYTKLVSEDGSTIRGCLTDLSTSLFVGCVLGNDANCTLCTGDGCNREVFPADRLQCYTCTSEDDSNCESNPTSLLACPYVTTTEKCRAALSGNITIRGCSSDVLCDTNDRDCTSCAGSACNVIDLVNREEDDGVHGMWQQLPLRCHTCVGDDCLYSLGPAYNCSGYSAQDCVTVFTTDGAIKRRGCHDEVEISEQRYCRENPNLCFTCKSNECNDAWNTTDYVQCNFCTSEKDPLCTTNPENAVFTKRACQKECMVAMKDSQVIRTCLDDKEVNHRYVCRANETGSECASCNTTDCNNFVFPADYLSCHVCNDSSCTTSTAQYCEKYQQSDYCFAKYENGNVELMGCASSQNNSDLEAWAAQNKLYTCKDNNCNDISILPTSGGECLSCNSALTPACAQDPTTYTGTETCALFENQCITYLSTEGYTRRSCLSKLSAAEQSSCQANGTCAICEGDKCNSEVFPSNRLKCHICTSASDDNCAANPNSLQICPVYKSNDRCVIRRSGSIERGCESELTCDTSDESNCKICGGDGCNTAELVNGALASTASLLTTFAFVIVAMLGVKFN